MTNLSSDSAQHLRQCPGDPQIVKSVIRQFQDQLREIERLRGEIESESRRISRDRESLKSEMATLGVTTSVQLTEKGVEYQSQISTDFYALQNQVSDLETKIHRMEGEKSLHEQQIAESETAIRELESSISLNEETLVFLREVSEVARSEIIAKIEFFVSKALSKVFGDGLLRFKIDMKVKSNVPWADFLLEDSISGKTYDILDSYGGGVADVVSTVLRLAILELQDPVNTGPVVLDEVGKFLSSDKQERFGEFLSSWSREFHRQIILVTHKPQVLAHADRVFRIKKEDICSIVEQIDPKNLKEEDHG